MKSLKAKRIAAVAASLLVGLAFAGQGVTFGNIPIINSQGQPVVQIVVGSQAAPSDGVVAANIAAVLGNLAFTSTNVTATVGGTSNLHCVISTPTCTLTNQQVYLGETGLASSSSSYVFSALIGSVLNRAVSLSTPASTKTLQGAGQYAFQETSSLTASPPASPYTAAGYVPFSTVTASNNGGGVSFAGFTSGGYDNILQVTNANLPSLLSNSGSNSESEILWVTGYPVYDQQNSVKAFQLLSAGGAYQIVFAKPIQNRTSSNSVNINAPIKLLGQSWTILNAIGAGHNVAVTSSTGIAGGKLKLAASLTPLTTLYVGQNLTTGPFQVVLQDLGQPNNNGISPASVAVYTNGKLTNETAIYPGAANITKFNISGQTLYLQVNQTFAGLYAYQKWAKIQAYSNIVNITSGHVFNQTNDPGWYASLIWTNTTASSGTNNAVALASIIIYNTTPTSLSAGQSLSFIQNPAAYKLTFVGDTLGSTNFDPVTAASSFQGSVQYQNLGTQASFGPTNVTEPAQELTVTSSIPGAFSYAGQASASVAYDLTPYILNEGSPANTASLAATSLTTNVVLTYANANFITTTNPLTVTVSGYPIKTAPSTPGASAITQQVQFQSDPAGTNTLQLSTPLFNVTSIQLARAIPGTLSVAVSTSNTLGGAGAANTVTQATLANSAGGNGYILYGPQSGKVYYSAVPATAGNSVIYNQQNGQPTSTFSLSTITMPNPISNTVAQGYGSFTINEIAVPTNTNAQDQLAFELTNSTGGVGASPLFQLNDSTTGTRNNMTYTPSNGGATFNVNQGFRTERGSAVQSITPSSVTINIAKTVDMLQFIAASSNTTVGSSATHIVGPIGIGQAVPGLSNVTVNSITASCAVSASAGNCTISGVSNLTATPSVTQAVTPVKLNTASTPLAVLDTNANSASTLIVVGSKYVNSVAGQVFSQNPTLNSSFGPSSVVVQAFGGSRILVAGYTANQTVQAGNQFIQDLLTASSA